MRLLEYEAKLLLKKHGLKTPKGQLVHSPSELENLMVQFAPPLILKVQIPSGGRMKAGGVVFANSKTEALETIDTLFGSSIGGVEIEAVLVEERVESTKEYYLAVAYDTRRKSAVAMMSLAGGIEVEAFAAKGENMAIVPFSLLFPFSEYKSREAVSSLGITGKDLLRLSKILLELQRIFYQYDCTLVEVNPLARTSDGEFVVLDAHIEIDDDALKRQEDALRSYVFPGVNREGSKPTDLELKALEIDRQDHRGVAGRVVEFSGDLGLLIGGGGASLVIFDAIRKYGGEPANYCEIGGNPSVKKIQQLTRLILSQKRVKKLAVIMNVVSNTRVDLIVRGVIKGILDLGHDPAPKIAIFRIAGAWEEEGYKILRKYDVFHCGRTVSLDEAARLAVERMS